MSSLPVFTTENPTDAQLVTILDHHYGDGVVHLPENTPWSLYTFARKLGYINEEGFVTSKGKSLVIDYQKAS